MLTKPEKQSAAGFLAHIEKSEKLRFGDGSGKLCGLSTGFEAIDSLTLGMRGLWGITGQPGAGKSTWAVNVALHVAAKYPGQPVKFVSAEMGKRGALAYLCGRLKGCSTTEIHRAGAKLIPEAMAKEPEKWAALGNIHLFDRDEITDTKSFVSKCQGGSLVVVDSMHGLPVVAGSDAENIQAWLNAFRDVEESGSAVLVVFQGTKQADKNESDDDSGMHSARGSAAISYALDVEMRLVTPKESRQDEVRVVTFRVAKNRMGVVGGSEILNYKPKIGLFYE